jgi:hypothetical protein
VIKGLGASRACLRKFEATSRLESELDDAKQRELASRQDAENKADADQGIVLLENQVAKLSKSANRLAATATILAAVTLCVGIEWALRHHQVQIVLEHPNSYALRAVTYSAIAVLAAANSDKKRRQFWLWSFAAGFVIAFLTLLGGPRR